MDINDAFPSKYIKCADLKGHLVSVVIESVSIEEVGSKDKPEQKPVMFFVGKEKGMTMNKTNAMVIADMFGPETNGWMGKTITLRPDKTQFKGDIVDCIRIQVATQAAPPVAAQAAAPATASPNFDDDIPF